MSITIVWINMKNRPCGLLFRKERRKMRKANKFYGDSTFNIARPVKFVNTFIKIYIINPSLKINRIK